VEGGNRFGGRHRGPESQTARHDPVKKIKEKKGKDPKKRNMPKQMGKRGTRSEIKKTGESTGESRKIP